MRSAAIVCFLLLTPAIVSSTASAAETLSCPLLTTAVQVGNCPSEDELKYTFTGYCSDNRRMYQDDAALCTDYQQYRKVKNLAYWESADGSFTAYLSCDLGAEAIRAAKASGMSATKQGKITLLSCNYSDEISFTHRSRRQCKVAGNGDCGSNANACKASCD